MRCCLAILALAACPFMAAAQQDTTGQLPGLDQLPEFTLQAEDVINGGILVEELTIGPGEAISLTPEAAEERTALSVTDAPGAILRGLDKITGDVVDLTLANGESADLGRLTVELGECRYPVDNPSGDAFAFLTIRADGLDRPAFEGWMVASSPALSALEHPRYDVWVIRCNTA